MGHYGIGELTAVTILAELGDVRRFAYSRDAVRYGGMDITVYAVRSAPRARAPLPPRTARAALGAVRGRPDRQPPGSPDRDYFLQAAERLGRNRACLALARKLLKRCYHTLRDLGEEGLAPA